VAAWAAPGGHASNCNCNCMLICNKFLPPSHQNQLQLLGLYPPLQCKGQRSIATNTSSCNLFILCWHTKNTNVKNPHSTGVGTPSRPRGTRGLQGFSTGSCSATVQLSVLQSGDERNCYRIQLLASPGVLCVVGEGAGLRSCHVGTNGQDPWGAKQQVKAA